MAEQFLYENQQARPYRKTGRGNTRLTREQYEEAKRCYEIRRSTPTMSDLARQYGITAETLVSTIRRGVKKYDQEEVAHGR